MPTGPARSIPFLRWPGGKRWLVAAYGDYLKPSGGRYFEPFLGGGAVFFHLSPSEAVLGDSNHDLIATYRAIRDDYQSVSVRLKEHTSKHSRDYYTCTRMQRPVEDTEVAARFIYLNRTCFNGLYRVNRRGEFNVPMGDRHDLHQPTDLAAISSRLQRAQLYAGDFMQVLEMVGPGDLVYLDPPYTVRHNTNGFIRYNEKLFSWTDQVRLAKFAEMAIEQGASVIQTNAAHKSILELYSLREKFKVAMLERYSSVAGRASDRNVYAEALITSLDVDWRKAK